MLDKTTVDTSVVTASLSSPLWFQHLEFWGQTLMLIGGLALLLLRIIVAVRDLRRKAAAVEE